MSRVRALYHRLLPATIRNPFGMARREAWDRLLRATTRPSLPPRSLLANIQLTPFVTEYLDIGQRSAQRIEAAISEGGIDPKKPLKLLDFGCGSARTLRHFIGQGWDLQGCDVDSGAIEWARRNIPAVDFRVNSTEPPLPYEAASFDVVVAVSLFTHFDESQQLQWKAELARVLRRGGVALVSTMGPSVLPNFPLHDTASTRQKLMRDGFAFLPSAEAAFNAQGAFHTIRGVLTLAGEEFELVSWNEQGLDGFQDLSLLRRR